MNIRKKILCGLLTVTFATSMMMPAFAVTKNSQQNDLYGKDFEALKLGDWVVDSQGNYDFKYSVKPFKNQIADDKGLIPYSSQGKNYNNPSNWAKSEVVKAAKMALSNMDIITNYQGDITRAEFARTAVQMYYKYAQWLDGKKEVPTQIETDIFDDIDVEENEEDLPIIHAAYLGITQGMGNNKFNPDDEITREQMATMLFRLCELFNLNFGVDKNMYNYFIDYKSVSSWAKPSVAALGNVEVFKGYPVSSSYDIGKDYHSNTMFMPKEFTTNEQALCLILRIAEKYLDPQVTHIIGQSLTANVDGTVLKWNAVYGADLYDILQYKWVSDTETTLVKSSKTQTTAQELEAYTINGYPTCKLGSGVYDFTVQPFNEFDNGIESVPVRIIVPHPVEKASIEITDNEPTVTTATLKWGNVSHFDVAGGNDDKGATKYRIVILENGTNKVLEDKYVNESTDTTTSIVLNEGLVENAGTYTIKIYAYNNAFASAPVTAQYEVVEETNAQGTNSFEKIPKVHSITEATDSGVPVGEFPIYSLNGNEFAYKYNDIYYRIAGNNPNGAMTNQSNINSLVPVLVDGAEIMEDVTELVVKLK